MNSIGNRVHSATAILAAATLLAFTAGCRVQVDKGANGEDKNVKVDTPFGGVHVNTDQTTAADLGLPVYPGAETVKDKDNDKSADIHLGFGQWEMRVKAVNYATSDSQDKVEAFYKKALGSYGDVIVCDHGTAVGKPTATSEGLTCEDNDKHGTHIQIGDKTSISSGDGRQLKAGSEHHQHIVGFQSPVGGQTRFALVAIDLPSGINPSSDSKD
jgi:hypothetical protein